MLVFFSGTCTKIVHTVLYICAGNICKVEDLSSITNQELVLSKPTMVTTEKPSCLQCYHYHGMVTIAVRDLYGGTTAPTVHVMLLVGRH